MGEDVVDAVVFVLVVGARFLVPLLIPRFPLPAIVASLVIDAADQSIFHKYTDLDLANYQSYDKALDVYYLTIAYLSVLRTWTNGFAAEVARFLWYYRLVGVALFELVDARWLLFVFPNTFEYFFIAYEVVRTGWDPRRLGRRAVLWLAAVIWVVIKLPQEWWIHIAQNDFTDFVQENLFGVEPETPWGETFANRPAVAVAIVAVIAAAVVGVRLLMRRLPPRDWSTRVDVDRPVPPVDVPGAEDEPLELRWPVVEKIALIALIGVIFGQMLEIDLSNLHVLWATALVVVLNAGLSVWLARRGARWTSLGLQFVVLVAANSAVLTLYASWARRGQVNHAAAVFFGVLLTLIIVMYDRFRTPDRAGPGASVSRGTA